MIQGYYITSKKQTSKAESLDSAHIGCRLALHMLNVVHLSLPLTTSYFNLYAIFLYRTENKCGNRYSAVLQQFNWYTERPVNLYMY